MMCFFGFVWEINVITSWTRSLGIVAATLECEFYEDVEISSCSVGFSACFVVSYGGKREGWRDGGNALLSQCL
jgi:hypothetical protein